MRTHPAQGAGDERTRQRLRADRIRHERRRGSAGMRQMAALRPLRLRRIEGRKDDKMVTITIDNQRIAVDGRLTILEAAKTAHIEIPHLCYLKGINDIGACRICAVELEGKDRLVTACNTLVQEGMVIYTNSPKVRHARRCNVQLLLSQHDCECAYCSRSGNCELQKVSNELGITA